MSYLYLLGLSVAGSLLALCGGIFFLYNKKFFTVLEKHAIPFAAGTLITVALLGIIPEALEMIGTTSLWIVLLSLLGAYIFENFILATHHHDHNEHHHGHKHENKVSHGTAGLVVLGDTVHNFIDGVAIGASFLVNPGLGIVTTISTFLHEVPHEIADFGILLKAGWKKKDVLFINVVSALFTVPGAFSVLLFANNEFLIASLLSVAAGIFLYLGVIDFIPQVYASTKKSWSPLVSLTLGVLIMMATILIVPHSHPEGDHPEHDQQHAEEGVDHD